MPYEVADRENIKTMVHTFYSNILKDDLLSPFFTRSLGEDIQSGKWPEHFQTLYDFWNLMITGQRGYGGNPFPPHAFLGALEREHFERWLKLFHTVLYEFYTPKLADQFYQKAEILAEQFIRNLGIDDEDEDD